MDIVAVGLPIIFVFVILAVGALISKLGGSPAAVQAVKADASTSIAAAVKKAKSAAAPGGKQGGRRALRQGATRLANDDSDADDAIDDDAEQGRSERPTL